MAAEDRANLFLDSSDGQTTVECGTGNEFDGRLGLRIAALFVILIGSTLGGFLETDSAIPYSD